MLETRRQHRLRWGAGGLASSALLLVLLLVWSTTTSAAYRDQVHVQTASLAATTVPPSHVGLSAHSRMFDTGLGLGGSGDVYVWGRTNLGINGGAASPGLSRGAQRVPLPAGAIRQVTGTFQNANALDNQGMVWGWGFLPARDGTDAIKPNDTPERVRIDTPSNGTGPVLDRIVTISSTESAAAGIRDDGTVWHWGETTGSGGNLGAGASQVVGLPDPSVPGNRPVYLKGANTNFYLMLENGDVWYWGGWLANSLPAGLGSADVTPRRIVALDPWTKSRVGAGEPYITAVDGGINMGGALLSDGQLLSWGLGSAFVGGRPVVNDLAARDPGIVPGLSGITSMQFGQTGVAMLDSEGRLWGYGAPLDNGYLPLEVQVISSGVVQFAAGASFFIWQDTAGLFWGRGFNVAGAIGSPVGSGIGVGTGSSGGRRVTTDLTAVAR